MRLNSNKKRTLYSIAISFAAILIVILFWSYLLCNQALHPPRDTATFESMADYYPQIKGWIDSIQVNGELRDTIIINENNESLHALFVAGPKLTNRTAVILHGYEGSGLSMLMIGYLFNRDLHFNVLLPDLKGHGERVGEAVAMGWDDRHEVVKWIEVADEIFGGDTQIVLHGISMGGAATMMVAGDANLPSTVKCAIEDSGYTSVKDAFSVSWHKELEFLKFPLFDLGDMWCKLLYGWSFAEASSLQSIHDCYLPMLFIHGEEDSLLPVDMAYKLYEAKPGEKELWILPGVDHGAAYRDYPDVYTQKVRKFVDTYFDID